MPKPLEAMPAWRASENALEAYRDAGYHDQDFTLLEDIP